MNTIERMQRKLRDAGFTVIPAESMEEPQVTITIEELLKLPPSLVPAVFMMTFPLTEGDFVAYSPDLRTPEEKERDELNGQWHDPVQIDLRQMEYSEMGLLSLHIDEVGVMYLRACVGGLFVGVTLEEPWYTQALEERDFLTYRIEREARKAHAAALRGADATVQ